MVPCTKASTNERRLVFVGCQPETPNCCQSVHWKKVTIRCDDCFCWEWYDEGSGSMDLTAKISKTMQDFQFPWFHSSGWFSDIQVHLAAEIMAAGPILGVNSSAVLMARIHKAEQMSPDLGIWRFAIWVVLKMGVLQSPKCYVSKCIWHRCMPMTHTHI